MAHLTLHAANAGPTEATVTATEMACFVDDVITIGHPCPNMHCYIVDLQMRVLPVGVPGELLLSGPGLATGECQRASGKHDLLLPCYCKLLLSVLPMSTTLLTACCRLCGPPRLDG